MTSTLDRASGQTHERRGRARLGSSPRRRRRIQISAGILIIVLAAAGYVIATKTTIFDRAMGRGQAAAADIGSPDRCDGMLRWHVVNQQNVPCLARPTTSDTGDAVTIFGYVGLPNGRPLTGARIELLTGDALLGPSGQSAISNGSGQFAFTVLRPTPHESLAFRFLGNAAYPAAASPIIRL